MNEINKTLYIPLYGKAFTSKKGVILSDKKAEEIWESVNFPLKGKSKSKWLAYYTSMRAVAFDRLIKDKQREVPNCTVLHLGCGLDNRIHRVNNSSSQWYDVDFPSVIERRKRYYHETDVYHMLSADITDDSFIQKIPKTEFAIVILEGVSMYLTNEQCKRILTALNGHFSHLSVFIDCYTPFAVKMSKLKNPVREVGVSKVFGIENPTLLEENTRLSFVKEHEITPIDCIKELKGFERFLFKTLYAGKISKKLYKLYEYKS